MHRMRHTFAQAGLALAFAALGTFAPARADLIRPDAAQSFPDLSGDIVGTQNYDTTTGLFTVKSAPSLLATGPNQANESLVNDPAGQARSQSLQLQLDKNGNLVAGANNSYSLYGSVVVDGKTYSGLLLQGTPTQFGFAKPDSQYPTMSVYDVSMALTGGQLKPQYGPDAYIRIIAETGSTFSGTFDKNFSGTKLLTNVRAYNAPSPAPVPEPSTFALLLACGGAGLLYRHRRRIDVADLSADD